MVDRKIKKGLNSEYFDDRQLSKSTKKAPESSLGIMGGGALDIGDLTSKLQAVNDEEEEAEAKKREFEEKRKNHYKNEFAMAQLLKNK